MINSLVFAFLRAARPRFINFSPEKSISINLQPTCPVAPADGTGVKLRRTAQRISPGQKAD
jgi:hypothetical protein